MSQRAWAYILGVFIATAAIFAASIFSLSLPLPAAQWGLAAALTLCATLAQLFKVEAPNNQTYYATTIFLFAGVLLLEPALFAVVVLVSYLIEWAKERLVGSQFLRKWYLQPFNICTHLLAGFAAKGVYDYFGANSLSFLSIDALFGIMASAIAYVAVNHVMVGLALVLARNVSWRESGILDAETLSTETILLFMGAVIAVLWTINPWLIVPALSPLVLMYKALMIPQLKHDAQVDAKTGLLNARHFTACFTSEMERAQRFNRPLSLIMADLDLLRNINNTYGHLAGDRVLSEMGRVIRETIREFDIAGRFGGEEFAIVLPEVEIGEAHEVGERLREAVEATTVIIGTSDTPITVTMSLGIASISPDVTTPNALLHEADIAVYQAKLRGRNCVVCISEVPQSIRLGSQEDEARLARPYAPTFVPRPDNANGVNHNGNGAHHAPDSGHAAPLYEVDKPASRPSHIAAQASTPPVACDVHAISTTATTPLRPETVAPYAAINEPDAEDVVHGAVHVKVVPPALAPAAVTTSHASTVSMPAAAPEHEGGRTAPQWMLTLFVGLVITLGVLSVLADVLQRVRAGTFGFGEAGLAILVMLVVLAMLAEYFQITIYGPETLSVSMALNFAAAPIAGVMGVAAVSFAIALVHYVRQRPPLYRSAFNWAMHLLAGLMPVLILPAAQNEHYFQNTPIVALIFGIVASCLAYFLIETGLLATAIALSEGKSPVAVWQERFQWLISHYMVLGVLGLSFGIAYFMMGALAVVAFVLPLAIVRYTQKQYVDRTRDSVLELQRMNQELIHANAEVRDANETMRALNEELFLTLSKIIDARDPYVGEHASKVSDYALAIARELGVPSERHDALRQAGFLHDIGKIGISEAVLHKPSKLTDEEYEYVKTHAPLGGEFLQTCRGLRHLSPFVRHHHERWDGKGYPDKLAGENIPLEARILAVCDSAEAMASDRPYHKGMSLDEMITEIKRCAGTQFDPKVAEAFVKVAEREREHLVKNSAQELLKKQAEISVLARMKHDLLTEKESMVGTEVA